MRVSIPSMRCRMSVAVRVVSLFDTWSAAYACVFVMGVSAGDGRVWNRCIKFLPCSSISLLMSWPYLPPAVVRVSVSSIRSTLIFKAFGVSVGAVGSIGSAFVCCDVGSCICVAGACNGCMSVGAGCVECA